jgi:sugar-specific transcriptional regulator TrmB
LSDVLSETIPVLKDNLGMSETEAKVYIPIALGGNMTAGSIAAVIGDNLGKVQRTLKRLEKKGLVVQLEGLVPLYRAISPNMTVNKALTSVHEELETFKNDLTKFSESQEEKVTAAVSEVLEDHETQTGQTKESFNQFEAQLLELLQTHIEEVADLANDTMSNFSESMESAIEQIDLELEEDLGLRLQELQKEIEKSQRKITTSLKKATRTFDKWLKTERASSAEALADFGVKAADLIDMAKSSVTQALEQSEAVLRDTGEDVKIRLTDQTLTASNEVIEVLDGVATELAATIVRFNEELGDAVNGTETAFTEFYQHARDSSKEHSQLVRERISSNLDILTSLDTNVAEWKEEVPRIISGSTQTLKTQLEQTAANDARYIETIKNIISGYLEKVNEIISEDYDNLRLISAEIGSSIEDHLGQAKNEIVTLIQTQSESDQTMFEESQKALQTKIVDSSQTIEESVTKNLATATKEIEKILQGSTTEFTTLTDTIGKKLSSTHKKVLSTSDAKHKSMLAGMKRFAKDFETKIENRFEEVITTFNTTTAGHLNNAKILYDTLNTQLDERLAKSVESLTSYVKQAQHELDSTIDDQTSRIDQHLQNVREEFHIHLEDITRQFISMTQGLEATFNGLLSSQSIEAKDLVTSIHTGFKASLKSELTRLEEDSLKLQQEYSSDIGQNIDELRESVTMMKDLLENSTLESRQQISEMLVKSIESVEQTVQTTKETLDTIESGPISQYQKSLLQASKDYTTSISSIQSYIDEKFTNLSDTIIASVGNNAESVRKSLDTFSSENIDAQQRLLADTSKKLDVLSTKSAKKSTERLEAFRTSLTESESKHSKTRNKINDDYQVSIEERRTEFAQAFDAASVWIESAVENLEESLIAVGGNLNTGISTIKEDLTKSADEIAESIVRKSKDRLTKLTTTGTELLQKAESVLRTHSSSFEKSCQTSLKDGKTGFSELPTTIGSIVEEIVTKAVTEANQQHHDVVGQLGESISEYESAVSSVVNEYSKFLENTSKMIMKNRDTAFEETKESVLLANQHASRKFEQVGLDLKTQLSNRTHGLIETVRGDITARTSEIADKTAKTTIVANEETSKIKQVRNECLNNLTENTDKTLRRWAADQKKQTETILEYIGTTMNDIRGVADKALEAFEALKRSGSKILALPSDSTWYVTGKEEICAYMTDMVQRAESSIILSVPDISCIDLSKLTKSKQPRRKVLVIPKREEPETASEKLKGWRIWETESPMLLAMIDNKELILGGKNLTDTPLAIVSLDETYLQLYHDVLGPAMILQRS